MRRRSVDDELALKNTEGQLTDEAIEDQRKLVGIPFEGRAAVRDAAWHDAIRGFARAIGDLNPMYTDRAYAERSAYGAPVVPPVLLASMDVMLAPGSSCVPGGVPGVHSIWTQSDWVWERAVLAGEQIGSSTYLHRVEVRESDFIAGRTMLQTYRADFTDAKGQSVGYHDETWIRFEREAARGRKKYTRPSTTLSKADIEAIAEEYRAERVRELSRPRWQDFEVGHEVPHLVKGPLTSTGEAYFESFFGIYFVAHGVAFELFDRHPALAIINEHGAPEPPQRVHWDDAFARSMIGVPGAYDLGLERAAWLTQVMTDFAGDPGAVRRLSIQYRKFNLLGDVTRCHGTITAIRPQEDGALVDLNLACVNQFDERTAIGSGTVLLPD